MKKKTKLTIRLLAAGAILTAGGLLLMHHAYGMMGRDISQLDLGKFSDRTYTAEGEFSSIDIETSVTDVTLLRSEDGSFRIESHEEENITHELRVEGGKLTVTTQDDRQWYEHIGISFGSNAMTVYLPAGSYKSVQVTTRTADISVPADLDIWDITVSSDTGDISLGASEYASVSARTDTGRVTLNGITVRGSVTLTTDTGKHELSSVRAESISLTSYTGSLTLRDTVASDELRLISSTGSMSLEACDSASIYARTATGNVTGSLLSGKDFNAKSSTGKVDVPADSDGGSCRIITDTGNISITVLE